MSNRVRLDLEVRGAAAGSLPVLEDLPAGQLAREIAEDALGATAPRLEDGRWVVGALVDGLRLWAAGDEHTWTILRPACCDEADATYAASLLHARIGSQHSEWDADR
jgi:hypothetical protein